MTLVTGLQRVYGRTWTYIAS